jgi:hypothetical protein
MPGIATSSGSTTAGIQVLDANGKFWGRSLAVSTDLTLTNADGQAGNPTLALATAINKKILLQEVIASSVASVTLNQTINATYENYGFFIKSAIPATNNVSLIMEWSTDNGATWLSTNYRTTNTASSPASNIPFVDYNASATYANLIEGCGNSTGNHIILEGTIFNPSSSSLYKPCQWKSVYIAGSTPEIFEVKGVCTNLITTAINAIRFRFSSGNITSGTFRLYGLS